MKVKDRDIIEQYVNAARTILGDSFVRAYWFGSRARGEENPASDSDVLIETEKTVTSSQRDALADVAVDLAADYGVLLDVHFYPVNKPENKSKRISPFILSVHDEGILL